MSMAALNGASHRAFLLSDEDVAEDFVENIETIIVVIP